MTCRVAVVFLVVVVGFIVILAISALLPRLALVMSVPLAITAFEALGKTEGFLVELDHFFGGVLLFVTGMMVAVALGTIAGKRQQPPANQPAPLPGARVISG